MDRFEGQIDEYRELIDQIELSEIALLHLKQHREDEVEFPLRANHTLDVRDKEITNRNIRAKVDFTFQAFHKDSDHAVIEIHMTWRVSYKIDDEAFTVSEEVGKEFLERNIPLNLWPYIRETVGTLTGKMGFAPLLLPTLKLVR